MIHEVSLHLKPSMIDNAEKLLNEHLKQKRKRLELNVYVKNKRAVQFYEREGFCIQREGKDAETGEKEYCMLWIK